MLLRGCRIITLYNCHYIIIIYINLYIFLAVSVMYIIIYGHRLLQWIQKRTLIQLPQTRHIAYADILSQRAPCCTVRRLAVPLNKCLLLWLVVRWSAHQLHRRHSMPPFCTKRRRRHLRAISAPSSIRRARHRPKNSCLELMWSFPEFLRIGISFFFLPKVSFKAVH